MALLPQYEAAAGLEAHLGDAADPANVFSFARAVALDEGEEYPEEARQALNAWQLHHFYVPAARGGRWLHCEESMAVCRMAARRDITAVLSHGKTFLGAAPVWAGAAVPQQEQVARFILAGEQIALALTERDHGSDLLASEVRAEPDTAGWRLSGEKWLINNATRARALSVFARTDPAGGPRGFSLFFVDKQELAPGGYELLPKVRTHGIRGADISGIRWCGALLPPAALLGKAGTGLEIILRAFHVTRTIIMCLSLGAADTALRCTADFALGRQVYGDSVFAIGHARRVLADAFADLLAADCVATAACRALHATPGQAGLWAAVSKSFVPATVDALIRRLAAVLGARFYLREEHWWGIFQKTARDHAIIGIFDGSTAVNLAAIGLHLRLQSRGARGAPAGESVLAALFALDTPLPPFDPAGVAVFHRGPDDVLDTLPALLEGLAGVEAGLAAEIRRLGAAVPPAWAALRAAVAELEAAGEPGLDKSAAMFDCARRYCRLFAAAACLHLWARSRHALGLFFARGEWLLLVLARLLRDVVPGGSPAERAAAEAVAVEVAARLRGHGLYGLVPVPLAGWPPGEPVPRAAALAEGA